MSLTGVDLDDPMLGVVGSLVEKAETPPEGLDAGAAGAVWRLGYQNAISDLVAALWPRAEGGRRLTLADLLRNDVARGGHGSGR